MVASARARRLATILGAAGAQLAVWVLIRPDQEGASWGDSEAVQTWLIVELVLAAALGVLIHDRRTLVRSILIGWLLQVGHFAFLGEHYESSLWGLGVFMLAFFAAVAAAVAFLAWFTARQLHVWRHH
jgi:hypothetical protein